MWRCLIFAIILSRGTLIGLSTVQFTSPQKVRGLRFLGRLEAINSTRKTLIVRHGYIQGYAERGIGEYKVDNEAVLGRLRRGDDISATVFPNDQTLYKIHVVYRRAQPLKAVKQNGPLPRHGTETRQRGGMGEVLSAAWPLWSGCCGLSIGNGQGPFVSFGSAATCLR
jgi:hypothetical protein